MPLLKKILSPFILFFAVSFMSSANEGEACEIATINQATINRANTQSLQYLKEHFLKEVKNDRETKVYLSLKEDCKEYKKPATECCSNPKKCSGLAKDIAVNALPLLPSLYGTYQGYRTSQKVAKREMTHEEARAKTCDTNNKINMGLFLGGLLAQMSASFESKCVDKIKTCQKNCNQSIDDFKEKFMEAFAPVTGLKTLDEITKLAEECKEALQSNQEIRSFDDANSFASSSSCFKYKNGSPCSLGSATATCEVNNDYFCVHGPTIGHIILYAKAYKNSTIKEEKELTEESSADEIVVCGDQKNRVLTGNNRPAGPVPQPMIDLCHQQLDREPPDIPPPLRSNYPESHSSLTGGDVTNKSKNPLLLGNPGENYGPVDDDDIPEPNNKPSPARGPTWAQGSSSGAGAGGGGSLGGGGLPGGSDDSYEGGDYPYSVSDGIEDSFGGDGFAGSFAGGGSLGDEAPYPYGKQAGLEEGLGKSPDFKPSAGDFNSGDDSSAGGSIFQSASQRIQQFCSDHNCPE